MFEEPKKEVEEPGNRKRALLVIGGIGVFVLLVFVWLANQALKPPQSAAAQLENAFRAGTTEFEGYRGKVVFDEKEIIVHPNMIGMAQYEVRAKMTNRGDRPINGIELLGRIVDLGDKVVAESTSLPIPRVRRDPLPPGESMRISVKVDAPSKVAEADVKDVTVELKGIRFQ
jgi:hypothetical protein